jgi:hypothetical protein
MRQRATVRVIAQISINIKPRNKLWLPAGLSFSCAFSLSFVFIASALLFVAT